MCTKCLIRKAGAGGLCALCVLGGITVASMPASAAAHPAPTVAATQPKPTGSHDHAGELHTHSEADAEQLATPETQITDRHVLVVGDRVHGQLDGRHYLGYCAGCPIAGKGPYCYGPCPPD
jgi:hypothetical protein